MKYATAFVMTACFTLFTNNIVFSEDTKSEIKQLSKTYDLAIKTKDEKILDKLIDKDCRFISDDGRLLDKKGHIAKISGRTYNASASEGVEIYFIGDLAIESATWVGTGQSEGRSFEKRNRYTTIWMRKSDGWVIISSQSTPITISP